MRTFKDTKGREWKISIALGEIEAMQDVAGVDFGDLKNLFENFAKALGDSKKFASILWVLVGEQVTQANLDARTFKSALNGETVRDAADAIAHEIIDFFPSAAPPLKRLGQAVKSRALKAQPAALAAMDRGILAIEAGTLDVELGLTTELSPNSESSNTATGSAVSVELTPDASRSDG